MAKSELTRRQVLAGAAPLLAGGPLAKFALADGADGSGGGDAAMGHGAMD